MSKWLQAANTQLPPPDKTDFTDKTPAADDGGALDYGRNEVSSVLSVLSGAADPAPSPALALIEALRTDMDLYAEALRLHGSMSYGQAMDVLGWGATRAGSAETDLRKAGRIEFNRLGRAVLIDREGGSE
ncbi:hypothetical protein SAMN05216228_1008120 [Rhizobium tibeticum]|uniref:Uncharacterized protein n=1 Tax=Rhizobium tibeticum TaxID=501024 RepID=A0A1H8K0W9_9HYPH|nr:hypothetical protein RTCCBAU85039_2338 [Rhizobium tibeticum]SEN86088.1 hypothetical protein SAMN05216228_1008120 [Rhizobium tibeticum]